MAKTILFYSAVPDKQLFETTGFYKTDIEILRELGFEVVLSNAFSDFFAFWKYDLAFIYFWTKGVVPAFISKLFRKKVLFTGGIDSLDQEFNRSRRDYTLKKYFFRLCTLFSDANIIVSRTDLKNIWATGFAYRDLHLVHHVIDFKAYAYEGRDKEDIFTTIVWMGTVANVQRKGIDALLYIFKELRQYQRPCRLLIIGTPGPGTEYLKEIIAEQGITEWVEFTGAISEVAKIDLLQRSRLYFQLSQYEGFGIAAVEALAAGNLVFHSGKGALSYILDGFGIEVDVSDYTAVARKVHAICRDYDAYRDQIIGGVNFAGLEYSYDRRKMGIKEILDQITPQ